MTAGDANPDVNDARGEQRELRDLLRGIEYAMLTTHAADGMLAGRPLQVLQVDEGGAIWFFTSVASAKVGEIRRDARVSLACSDTRGKFFVAIAGRAEIVVDRSKVDELWSVAQRVFFPQGRDDPSLVLIKVTPASGRYWDGNESALGLLLKFGKAVMRSEASDIGTHGTLDLGA